MNELPANAQDAETGGQLVSIVVPTYNEAENLRALVERIGKTLTAVGSRYEIIIVDDDSCDGTAETIADLAEHNYAVRLITRLGERGLSSAVIRGFNEAAGEILVCMDADLSHPPEAIPTMLQHLDDSEVDFVIGSRYVAGGRTDENWGPLRWLNSRVATLMARPFTTVKDPMSGFFAVPQHVFKRARMLNPLGFKIGLELIAKCNCRNIREIPIHFTKRKLGQSKLTFREQINYLKHLKRLADFKHGGLLPLGLFCCIGLSGMAVDLAVYAALLDGGVGLVAARAFAILAAMSWNFFFNRRIAFSYGQIGTIFVQYLRYIASCGPAAATSFGTYVALVWILPFFGRHVFLAAFIGIILGTVVKVFFTQRRPAQTAS